MAGKGPVLVSRDTQELGELIFKENIEVSRKVYNKKGELLGEHQNLNFETISGSQEHTFTLDAAGFEGEKFPQKVVTINREQERRLTRFRYVLDQYQEQPALIDKHTNDFIKQILSKIREETCESEKLAKFKFFYLLTKLRGAKRTLKCLPHQVDDLYWALENLEKHVEETKKLSNPNASWETSFCYLLCLSVTSLIPFHMSRFDGKNAVPGRMLTVEKLINIGKSYILQKADITQDAAALMLGRLFSRSDVQKLYLSDYLAFTVEHLNDYLTHDNPGVVITGKTIGVIRVLCILVKSSEREKFLEVIEAEKSIKFDNLIEFIDQALNREFVDMKIKLLCTKLAQRIALLHLPQKVVTWRYNRGKRTLADLENQEDDENMEVCEENEAKIQQIMVPDIVEDVMDILLRAITDRDIIVRWSAAKGIGRITQRLPSDLAEQTLPALLQEAAFAEDAVFIACSYHGICLVLAELARRALIAESELPAVVDFLVDKALEYDEQKSSTYSIGSFVRDSACYVAWAFARAYEAHVMKPFVARIAAGLLVIATTDREVNCRRAASAAFQENVGRQGQFPAGIDIVVKVDYREVALKRHSITVLAPWVCEKDDIYKPFFLRHITDYKLVHYDEEVRSLCANAFAQIYEVENFEDEFVPGFISNALNQSRLVDLSSQHGAVLVLAELAQSGKLDVNSPFFAIIMNLPTELESIQRWKGVAGELLRPATFKLCQGLTDNYNVPVEFKQKWSKLALDTILHVKWFQESRGSVKVRDLMSQYSVDLLSTLGDEYIDVEAVLSNFNEPNEDVRAGLALVLGSVKDLKSKRELVIEALMDRIVRINESDKLWTVSRRDAVKSLAKIAINSRKSETALRTSDTGTENIITSLAFAANDYTISKAKGDIGCYVRRAALEAIASVKIDDERLKKSAVREMGSRLVQVRDAAREAMISLNMAHVPIVASDTDCFKCIAENYAELYPYEVMLSLFICAGDLTESISNSAVEALRKYILQKKNTKIDYSTYICQIIDDHIETDRVIVPVLKALQVVLTDGHLVTLEVLKRLKLLSANKSKLIQRIMPATLCITALMANTEEPELLKVAVSKLSLLLCHNFPRIRQHTATAFSEVLLLCDDTLEEIFDKFDGEKLQEVLDDTEWDAVGKSKEIKGCKEEIQDMFTDVREKC